MTRVVKNPSGYRSKGRNGVEKAHCFGVYAKQHGWTGKYHLDENTGIVYLFARRGEHETIEIWWTREGKALPRPDLPVYTLGGERIKLLNVSAAAAIAAKSEDDAAERRAATKRVKPKAQRQQGDIIKTTKFVEMDDTELERLLYGRRLRWVNSISGEIEEAIVSGNKIKPKVIRNGHDRVDFLCDEGFRSAYLDQIVSVR